MRPDFDRILRLFERGQVRAAEALCDAALRRDGDDAELLHYKGAFAMGERRWTRALEYFRQAAASEPGDPRYHLSLAICLWVAGGTKEAAAAAERGLRKFPRNRDLTVHWAKLLDEAGDPRAFQALLRAIPLTEKPAPLLSRAAWIAENDGHLSRSAELYAELLKISPRDEAALNSLACLRSAQGRIGEALRLLRKAASLPGAPPWIGSNRLLTLLYDPGASASRIFFEHRSWAARVGDRGERERAPGVSRKKLRIGYVSADFRLHAVAYFAESILERHDRGRIETHCFSNSPRRDRVTARFRKFAAGWHQIDEMSDDEAAEAVRRAKIDVLVDMSGHSSNNRLTLFAQKPAPIQVNYLGYQATTGLQAIDYRFTDSLADPPGLSECFHSETLVRLDPCFQCYRPLLARIPVDAPPCESRGYVTLACFAIRQKLSPPLLEAWAEILRRSRAKLLLKCYSLSDREVRRELIDFFDRRGVSRKRLLLADWTPGMRAHLASYSEADLMLDTYPYNSATMTCEALWRGVPTVTWAGKTFVSRMGVSILTQVGLEDLIATSAAGYVEKAVRAISDASQLGVWRRSMRKTMRASPLMDAERLTRQIEDAYFRMWRA